MHSSAGLDLSLGEFHSCNADRDPDLSIEPLVAKIGRGDFVADGIHVALLPDIRLFAVVQDRQTTSYVAKPSEPTCV